MARRPVPSTPPPTDPAASAPSPPFPAGARSAWRGVRDRVDTTRRYLVQLLRPLTVVCHGLLRQGRWVARWWAAHPNKRHPSAFVAIAGGFTLLVFVPYGPTLTLTTLLAGAAWAGRHGRPAAKQPSKNAAGKLQALYEALTPYLGDPRHPKPLYSHEGNWSDALSGFAFDEADRLIRLGVRYPAYFTDQEALCRAQVEHVLSAKAGRDREYHFHWQEQDNRLLFTALPPLPTDVVAQRFATEPEDFVLGFTDADTADRTRSVSTTRGGIRDTVPVIWRVGPRSTEPHLLALGGPGSGGTALLRSLTLQAIHHADVLVIDGRGTGEHACLTGRPGVLAVESGLAGTLAALEWAAHETERRLICVNRARQAGEPPQDAVGRPLWIVVDRPTSLTELAAAEGKPDPQTLLDTALRHGRAASVVVATAETLDGAADLLPALFAHSRARVTLGSLARDDAQEILGAPLPMTPPTVIPVGRGYVRLGHGPIRRLQVPHTPDPYDHRVPAAQRQAVLSLLNGRTIPAVEATPEAPSRRS